MRFGRLLGYAGAIVLLVAAAGVAWIMVSPPGQVRVATGYAAKMVCSNLHVAGRAASEVMAVDVQAPGHPIFKAISVDVDGETVRARLLGFIGIGGAETRGADGGCSVLPGRGDALGGDATGPDIAENAAEAAWPIGAAVEPAGNAALEAVLDDASKTGPGMRAVVVVKEGRIIAERYGEGFDAATPLLGWSMTKTVTAAIIGTLVKDGTLSLDQTGLFEAWRGDDRNAVTLADLMGMASGLEWNEGYGSVSDVTRMLYLEGNMAGFAAGLPLAVAPEAIGTQFNYSSGTTVMLSRIWMDALGPERATAYPAEALFGPLGMTSAVLERDAGGTFVGSSYLYATARDWARFGLLLAQRGAWLGRSLLPAGYVDWMTDPHPASKTEWGALEYGRGQIWLRGPEAGVPPGTDPDAGFDLPDDAVWMLGHDGQSIAVVPSRGLVVVRLGLTPSEMGYQPQALLQAVIAATGG